MDEARRDGDSLRAEFEQREAELIRVAKATRRNGQREMLLTLEVGFISELPRPSHVGRALFEKGAKREKQAIGSMLIYEHLNSRVPKPLSGTVQAAVTTILDPDTPRERRKPASSAVTKSMDIRRGVLVDTLQAARAKKKQGASCYWLTPLGCKLFNGWPEWQDHLSTPGG